MMGKKFFLFLIVLIALSSFVFADKTYQVNTNGGLSIIYSKDEIFKADTNLSLHYHVFNSSNYLLANTQYNCTAHILNENQIHVYEGNLINNGNNIDKLVNIDGKNLSIGFYTVNLWCNSSSQAGFLSNYFYITQDGLEDNTDSKFTFVLLFGILLVISFLLILAFKLDEVHKILKTFILLITIYLVLMIPRALVVLINNEISKDLLKYYTFFITIVTWYILFYFIWSIAEYYGKTAEIKRFLKDKFGNKGGNNES